MNHRPVVRCRCCNGARLEPIVDLGSVPLANAFQPSRDASEERFPLAVVRCGDCGLLTLTVVVAPEVMFTNYPYVSGTSPTMVEHFGNYARDVAARFGGFVVEVGSNDGTLLRQLPDGTPRLGVEPADNIATLARNAGVPTRTAFFNSAVAREIVAEHGRANVLIGNNVIAHIDDIDDVATAASALLGDSGVFVFEVPHALTMRERIEFDTIYHEHLSYFTLRSLIAWLSRHNFEIFDVRPQTVHGGSIRVHAARTGKQPILPSVGEVLAAETAAGLDDGSGWRDFSAGVASIRTQLPALIDLHRARGLRVAGYGAAAKGNTLLCTCGLDDTRLEYVVDRNPLKQGLFTPGSHLKVVGVEALTAQPVDVLVVLAWNFLPEIRRQLADWENAGGRFVVPIPEPRVLSR